MEPTRTRNERQKAELFMKAMLYTETGGPEVLKYVDVADPEPGAGG